MSRKIVLLPSQFNLDLDFRFNLFVHRHNASDLQWEIYKH